MTKMQRLGLSALFFFICLFTISTFVSSLNQKIDESPNDTDKYVLSENNHSTLHADDHHTDFSHSHPQLPAEPVNTPSEPGNEDNKDNDEDDDDLSKLYFRSNSDCDFAFISSDVSFAQYEQNVLKRTKISLVVLHHSWKNFLS